MEIAEAMRAYPLRREAGDDSSCQPALVLVQRLVRRNCFRQAYSTLGEHEMITLAYAPSLEGGPGDDYAQRVAYTPNRESHLIVITRYHGCGKSALPAAWHTSVDSFPEGIPVQLLSIPIELAKAHLLPISLEERKAVLRGDEKSVRVGLGNAVGGLAPSAGDDELCSVPRLEMLQAVVMAGDVESDVVFLQEFSNGLHVRRNRHQR